MQDGLQPGKLLWSISKKLLARYLELKAKAQHYIEADGYMYG